MPKTPEHASDKTLKRGGLSGIVIGVLALVACELPIILAFAGLGGLSAGATALRPPPFVELIASALFVIGVFVLSFLFLKRIRDRRKASRT